MSVTGVSIEDICGPLMRSTPAPYSAGSHPIVSLAMSHVRCNVQTPAKERSSSTAASLQPDPKDIGTFIAAAHHEHRQAFHRHVVLEFSAIACAKRFRDGMWVMVTAENPLENACRKCCRAGTFERKRCWQGWIDPGDGQPRPCVPF